MNRIYYIVKPLIPRKLQLFLRRRRLSFKLKKHQDVWPIYEKAGETPAGFPGWYEKKKFALVLTHDVDTAHGQEKCTYLMNLEKELGFFSTFFFVPERYENSLPLHQKLKNNGFEVAIHGLNHDGKLYKSKKVFLEHAARINHYLNEWGASGIRSPSIHHNLEWIHNLNVEYDASTYDTDPFELQGGGIGTIFPFIVEDTSTGKSYVELPYTLPQDHLLYVIMKEKNTDIWKRKIDWIVEHGGMVHFITHPDYMNLSDQELSLDEYPVEYYIEILNYIKEKYKGQYWLATAKDVAKFWAKEASCIRTDHTIQKIKSSNACSIVYSFYEEDYRVRRCAEVISSLNNTVEAIALRLNGGKRRQSINNVNVFNIQKREFSEKGPLSFLIKIILFFFKGSLLLCFRHLRYRYKIIHIHNVPDFLVFMGLIPKLLGAKLILDIHDIVPELYCQKFKKDPDATIIKILFFIEKISVHLADHVIVANDIWRKKIINRTGIPPSKCTTLLNYPELSFLRNFKPKNESKEFTILYPGTISHIHGIDIALKAVSIVKKEVPCIRLHIYGGPKNNEYKLLLEDLIERLKLHDHVKFFDFVPFRQMEKIFSTADIGIVPKRGGIFAGEAFSTKIPEFLAVGLPVVASRTKIDDYYFDDSIIQFFEPENHEDLARCILELYHNKKKQKSLVENGKKFIAENNWSVKKSIYSNILTQLLG